MDADVLSAQRHPARLLTITGWLACTFAACLLILALAGAGPTAAQAAGNASAAAGFIESAQNKDGGFGEKRGHASSPEASLWAAAALLAAGKNPGDEYLKGGASLDEYLASNYSSYTSLSDLGLLTMVQAAAQGSSAYGNPEAKLEGRLTPSAARSDPGGAALSILGLLAVNSSTARQTADAAAQALLTDATPDGGWGSQGLSDSASTALVLQALAASGAGERRHACGPGGRRLPAQGAGQRRVDRRVDPNRPGHRERLGHRDRLHDPGAVRPRTPHAAYTDRQERARRAHAVPAAEQRRPHIRRLPVQRNTAVGQSKPRRRSRPSTASPSRSPACGASPRALPARAPPTPGPGT